MDKPQSKDDTSLEGWVCPYCGPGIEATFEENCADCGRPLESPYVKGLLHEMSATTECAEKAER